MRFLKATIALICLPAIASAWGNLYARNAEAEALANPHAYAEAEAWAEAYANAIADADADAYTEADEEIDLQTRDTDASAEQEEHLSLYARYADAYAEPYTDADAGFLSFYERDALPYPVPVKDLTREQIAACRQRANKGTAEYKQLEAAFRTVLAKYSSERNLETRIKLAEQLARASQRQVYLLGNSLSLTLFGLQDV